MRTRNSKSRTVSRRSMQGSGVVKRGSASSKPTAGRMSGDGLIQFLMKQSPKNIVGAMMERGLSGPLITRLKNKIPRGDPSWASQFVGEKHIPIRLPNGKFAMSNFSGPGTKIHRRLARNDQPRTISDKVSKAHDIRYTMARNVNDVRKADLKMIRKLKDIKRKKQDRPFNIFPGLRGIQAKIGLEKTGLLARNKFAPSGKTPTPVQAQRLKKNLRALEQQGFGPSEQMVKALAKMGIAPRRILPGQLLKEQVMKFEPEKLVATKLFPLLIRKLKKAKLIGSGFVLAGGRIRTKKGIKPPKFPFGITSPAQITPKKILKILRIRRRRRKAKRQKGGSVTATIAVSIASALLPIVISLGTKGLKALFKKIKAKKGKKGSGLGLAGKGIKEAFAAMIKKFIENPAMSVAKKAVGGFVKLLLKGAKGIREEREKKEKGKQVTFFE